MTLHPFPLALAAVLLFAVTVTPVCAQFVWTGNGASGNVLDPNNWGGSAPTGNGTEDVAFGDIGGSQTNVLIPTSALHNITFNGSSRPVYTFSGQGPTPTLTLGGNVTMVDGNPATFDSDLAITLASGTHTVDVSGPSTLLTVSGNIGGTAAVSKIGTGTLTFSGANTYDGGTTIKGGTMTVNGGSISHVTADTVVGDVSGDNGTLALTAGGIVSSNHGYIGLSAGSSGTATVDGTGTTWTNSAELYVGDAGTGSLALTSGGTVSNSNGYIGTEAGSSSTVTVDGAGSHWTNSGSLIVGYSGTGTLALTNGGAVSSANGIVGFSAGSNGLVTIDGASSIWTNSGNLSVGASGTGYLTLANGGTVSVNGGAGTLTLAGSTGSIGVLIIGDSDTAAPGGILNAATINTITGGDSGSLQFYTNATLGSPYYLTKDGTVGGAPVAITGPTLVVNQSGYNVLKGANTSTGQTVINGGTLADGAANAFSSASTVVVSTGANLQVNFNETIGGLEDGEGGGTATVASGATLTANNAASNVFSGVIVGDGSLTKSGIGTLTLTGANTYTGGTTVNSGALLLGTSSNTEGPAITDGPVGTGTLALMDGATLGGAPSAGAITLHNDIALDSSSGTNVAIDTSHGALTLFGNISGAADLAKNGVPNLDLYGNNTFTGDIYLNGGTTVFHSNTAAGTGILGLGNTATADFQTAAPVIYGLEANSSSDDVLLQNGSTLTINQNTDTLFYGNLDGHGGASIVKDGTGSLTFVNSTDYDGSTTIKGGTLAAGNHFSFGSSSIVVNGGTLSVNSGVTINNPISFGASGGVLAGSGTFAAAVDTGGFPVVISPGNSPGTLTFGAGLTLASSSAISFQVQDANGPAGTGYDLISVSGGVLNLTASSNTLTFNVVFIDSEGGDATPSNFNPSSSYSWMFATAANGITGFDPNQFHLVTGGASAGLPGIFSFTESLDQKNLFINFSPIPEPSTNALLAVGLGLVAFGLRRRRVKSSAGRDRDECGSLGG